MREIVLDPSVVLKWLRAKNERRVDAAGALRVEFQAGRLLVVVPRLLELELLNAAGRAWKWNEERLVRVATAIESIGFDRREPELKRVAHWTAQGLTAYDAVYVALAEAEGIELVTDDDLVLELASAVARPLGE